MKLATKTLHVALGVLAAGSLLNIGRAWLTHHPVRAQTDLPFPYTVVLEQTPYDAQGHAGPKMTMIWAVRSDGSQVTKLASSRLHQRIIDMASGQKLLVDDAHQYKSTTAYSFWKPERWLRNPKAGCLAFTEQASSSRLEGNQSDIVAGYRTVKIEKGGMTSWYAPDYGCALIQSTADWGNGAKTEERFVSLSPGEPTDTLSVTLPEYREAPPSQIEHAFASDLKENCCNTPPERAKAMDAEYYAHRTR